MPILAPGGWSTLLNAKITKAILIGSLLLGGGVSSIYGTSQGAQASWFCEAALVSATKNTVAYSCLNPLPNGWSGAILPVASNFIMVNEATAPATRLNIGTAAASTTVIKGTAALANVASGVVLGAKEILTLANTGALTAHSANGLAPIVLAPRNDTNGKRFLNFSFQRGSGATVSGEAPAYIHIEVVPCNLNGVGC